MNVKINEERILSSKNRLNSATSIKNKIKEEIDKDSLILHLPTEIICHIMSYLPLNDKKNSSLISKRWRNSFEEGFMLKEIVVKGNDNLINKNDNKLYEKAVNLEFKNDVNLSQFENGLANNSLSLNNLRHLTLENCNNLNSKILFSLLKVSPNIEKLHLIQCDSLLMNGFS
jgi:hypothetical protein